ncbi:MAG: hypothetical protein ACOWW1_10105 [archaeon]
MSVSKEVTVKQRLHYVIDLSLTRSNGDFLCPRCGLLLSPSDETEDNYCILGTTINDESLEELHLQCQHCRSEIRLVGFSKFDT